MVKNCLTFCWSICLKDGAKCGNGVDKTECNQTAGMELRLGLEYRKNCPPGKGNNLDVKFNHNLTSTKSSRIKGGEEQSQTNNNFFN